MVDRHAPILGGGPPNRLVSTTALTDTTSARSQPSWGVGQEKGADCEDRSRGRRLSRGRRRGGGGARRLDRRATPHCARGAGGVHRAALEHAALCDARLRAKGL